MEQQLALDTIEIVPATMNEVLPKICAILSQNPLSDQTVQMVVKSLFYGLWNFDKMINQHHLSTNIAQMLHKLPKKNCFTFLAAMFEYLHQKWNFIDHHRINKFMQLVRYLLKQGLRISQKKTDEVLLNTIFANISLRSGIAYHTAEIYFQTICDIYFSNDQKGTKKITLPFQKLAIFQQMLVHQNSLQHFRLHVMEKVYQKYKTHLVESIGIENDEQIFSKIEEFNQHVLQLAKNEQKDLHRKNLYALVGFMKSDEMFFDVYLRDKEERAKAEKQKKKKKITKGKAKQIKELKKKRKQKNKGKKRAKMMSRNNFQFKAREVQARPMMV